MTKQQKSTLNKLLCQDIEYFYPSDITFLILLSQYMRFTNLSRSESIKLQSLGDNILDGLTDKNCEFPLLFAGVPIFSLTTPESSPVGPPMDDRPYNIINLLSFGTIGGSVDMNIYGMA